jgi:hypothetical protein
MDIRRKHKYQEGSAGPSDAKRESRSVAARFGLLGEQFGVFLPLARRYRRTLGLSVSEVYLAEQLLFHHRIPGDWCSMSQEGLAAELGVRRQNVNRLLVGLRKKGLVAVRPDLEFSGPGADGTPPFKYSAEPVLAAVLLRAAQDEVDLARAAAMRAEARRRLERLEGASGQGWIWECEGLSTAQGAKSADVRRRFEQLHDPRLVSAKERGCNKTLHK